MEIMCLIHPPHVRTQAERYSQIPIIPGGLVVRIRRSVFVDHLGSILSLWH